MPRQDDTLVNRKLGSHQSEVEGKQFAIYPTVFSPEVNSSTRWASSVVPTQVAPKEAGTRMLEIGTGCGAIGIISALRGCPFVLATDINPQAVECARYNASQLGVGSSMEFAVSDIYDAVPKGKGFDVIFWNFPFNYPKEELSLDEMDYCEKSLWDPGYHLLERYLAEAREHLKPNGRVFITFSPDTGNAERFSKLTLKHDWTPVLFASKDVPALGDFSACFNLYELHDNKTKNGVTNTMIGA